MARFHASPAAVPPSQPAGQPLGTPLDLAANLFGRCGLDMAERAVELVRDWRPDCVVHSALDGAGPLAASALGVPLVRHTCAMGPPAPALTTGVWRRLEPLRHEYRVPDEPPVPLAVIDPGPPSVRLTSSDAVRPCRFVPFNGGGRLPDWLSRPSSRPRLCLTLGTVLPMIGAETIRTVLDAVSALDAEVVLTAGRADLSGVGALPDNVRPAGYVPLSVLLPACAAVVHHGGAGTAASALAVGLPQLALPLMADQFDVSAAIERSGAGVVEPAAEMTVDRLRDALRRLLTDDGLRARAAEVAAENAVLPGPADAMAQVLADAV